jgi:uncharacterized protein YuzE
MNFNYDNETDTLYIVFSDKTGSDSNEIAKDFIVDLDNAGNVVGLEILNVKEKFSFDSLIFDNLPLKDIRFLNQKTA